MHLCGIHYQSLWANCSKTSSLGDSGAPRVKISRVRRLKYKMGPKNLDLNKMVDLFRFFLFLFCFCFFVFVFGFFLFVCVCWGGGGGGGGGVGGVRVVQMLNMGHQCFDHSEKLGKYRNGENWISKPSRLILLKLCVYTYISVTACLYVDSFFEKAHLWLFLWNTQLVTGAEYFVF